MSYPQGNSSLDILAKMCYTLNRKLENGFEKANFRHNTWRTRQTVWRAEQSGGARLPRHIAEGKRVCTAGWISGGQAKPCVLSSGIGRLPNNYAEVIIPDAVCLGFFCSLVKKCQAYSKKCQVQNKNQTMPLRKNGLKRLYPGIGVYNACGAGDDARALRACNREVKHAQVTKDLFRKGAVLYHHQG